MYITLVIYGLISTVILNLSSAAVVLRALNVYDKQAPIGSTVELSCKLTNYYGSRLTWRKLEGRLSDDSEERNGKLIIHEVKKEDSGEYECIHFDDSYTKRIASSQVKLTVFHDKESGSIKNLNYEPVVEKELGDNVELFCEFTNEPQLKWKKIDGQMTKFKTEYGAPNNRLMIHYLNDQDAGVYECFLPDGRKSQVRLNIVKANGEEFNVVHNEVNEYGDEETDTQQPSGDNEEFQPVEKEEDLGTDVELICNIESENFDDIDWKKIGEDLDQSRIEAYENKIRIRDLKTSDSGTYQCTIGDKKHQIKLKVKESNSNPSSSEEPERPTDSDESIIPAQPEEPERPNEPEEPQRPNEPEEPQRPNEPEEPQRPNEPEEPNNNQIQARIEKPSIRVNQGDNIENVCHGTVNGNGEIEIEWYNSRGQRLESDFRIRIYEDKNSEIGVSNVKSTLRILGANLDDAGNFECRVKYLPDGPKSESTYFSINVDQIEENRPSFRVCDVHEATCRNGQCIPRTGLCNGFRDCNDGSDEECESIVGLNNQCQPNEKKCRSGGCVQKIWFCDGERDCDDGTDEESCGPPGPGEMCKTTEFMCKNQKQCVLKGFLCDKQTDCSDNSDEIGCESPRITLIPIRHITVSIGGTFRIECHATGFPTPFINWRLNWGHICEEPRCTTTNENGRGILTVTDARYYDAGAYSCESLNSQGREFAVPDTIVEIRNITTPPPPPPTQVKCFCNYHSDRCDQAGICLNCDHNTYGRNCEYCKPGYYGDATGGTPYDCSLITAPPTPEPPVPSGCNCHNHSDRCTCSGICLECEHNTEGRNCHLCKPGYYGDATRGTPFDCLPFGITTTTTTTQRTTTVHVEAIQRSDCFCHNHSEECTCSGICVNCQHNTDGKYCDVCKSGYVGNAKAGTPFDCLPIQNNAAKPVIKNLVQHNEQSAKTVEHKKMCNPHGTIQTVDNNCRCKSDVIGIHCDQCAPRSFNLITHRQYKRGCLSCFCNGLDVDCGSSDLSYERIQADFENEGKTWFVSDKFTKKNIPLEVVDNGIEFNQFDDHEDKDLFIIVPEKFKGNKLSSYGGNFTVKIQFSAPEDENSDIKNFELRLSGSHVNVVYKSLKPLIANEENEIVIPLYEDEFKRYGDNGKVNREHMLMALSDIKLIMIRAHYATGQTSIRLNDFVLDHAEDAQNTIINTRPALSVEVCNCPEGYTGKSCESCAPGYQRSSSGFYLGLCERA